MPKKISIEDPLHLLPYSCMNDLSRNLDEGGAWIDLGLSFEIFCFKLDSSEENARYIFTRHRRVEKSIERT